MISGPELRKIARETRLPLDLVEKDYALGWVLCGLSSSPLSDKLVLKGGTALSRVYFPSGWRLSEDLDFTVAEHSTLEEIRGLLVELSGFVEKVSGGMDMVFKDRPFVNPGFIRVRAQYTGPVSKNTVKIEVTKEKFIGDYKRVHVPVSYDYPEFSTIVYTLENILAEKLRAIIERGMIRDYYDSWKLLRSGAVDVEKVKKLFLLKCEGKGLRFRGVEQFFPRGIVEDLEQHMMFGLTRLNREPLPPLHQLVEELKADLGLLFDK